MRKNSAIYLSCADDEFSVIQSGDDVNLKQDSSGSNVSNPCSNSLSSFSSSGSSG